MTRLIKFAPRGAPEVRIFTVQEFEAATGHLFLPELEFQNETVLERIRTQCARALEIGQIGQQSRWLGVLHAEQIKNRVVADVSIRWINETIRHGLFAEEDIAVGDFIGEYTGVVRKCNLIFGNINEYCFGYPTSALSFRKHVIDALEKGNELRYANHSDSANCESMGVLVDGIMHIIVRAIRPIPRSTQITYDYSGFHWLKKKKRKEV